MSKKNRNFWRQSRCAVHQIAMLVFEPTLRRSCCWTIWAEVAASCFHGFSELQNKVDLFGLTGMRSWPNLVAWLVWHMAENIGWENAATDTGDLRSLLAWLPPSSCWCWPIVQETIEASLRNERGKKKEEVHKTLFSGVCTSLAKEAYMMNVNDPCSGGCTSLVRTLMDNENMSMIVACTSLVLVRRCDNENLWMKSLLRKVYLLGQDRKSEFIMETLVNDLCSGGFSLRQGMWHMNLHESIMETVTSKQDKHVWSNTFSPIC